MTEVMHDPEHGSIVLNESLIDSGQVMSALTKQHPEVAALVQWAGSLQPVHGQRFSNTVMERDKYVLPRRIFDQFKVANMAVELDDIVSGVLETTESLALSRMDFEAEDQDEEDVWNQIGQDLDLDARLREMWRELFTYSQFTCGIWWGRKTYKVRGKTASGVARKKTFTNLAVPLGLTLLDPVKVVPVGSFLFNQEQLVYIADKFETSSILDALNKPGVDPLVNSFLLQPYEPAPMERGYFSELGVTHQQKLFLCNPQAVWRHTETRPAYQKFATLRMKSVFELLDLKQQLKQMDRAQLLGGTNFIILITKGTDDHPARPGEVESLQTQVRTVARVPIIVGDHRLKVEIITPSNDNTLKPERYNAVDSRITARLYQMFMLGNYSAGGKGDDSVKLARVVARGMESRRHMIRRSLEAHVFHPTVRMNPEFTSEPDLRFHPKRVALDFDQALAAFLLDLRDRGDISRDSILAEFDFSQEEEARKREREAEQYDDIFQTAVPYAGHIATDVNTGAAAKSTPGAAGAPASGGGGASTPNIPPHGHAPTGEPVPLPTPSRSKTAANKKTGSADTKSTTDPKSAGRRQGGTKNGGGAAPGSGQGQAPRNPRRKAK
jgi:hypothetical protein